MQRKKYKSVDEYIKDFPSLKSELNKLRSAIKKTAPKVVEKISYNIPAYHLNGYLVYFAAYEKHIGFYPGAAAIIVFRKELSNFKLSKGTVQFPINKPIPLSLVKKIVQFRIIKNLEMKKAY
jgi:uncharacterized protein YdhG (YjbR/CyaY superfamily)